MTQTAHRAWMAHAIPLGLMAGLGFVAFGMLAAGSQLGMEGLFMPLRMIGAIVLGAQALQPSYSLLAAATTGMVVRLILSVAFAVLFVALFQPTPTVRSSRQLLLAGCLYGVLLWVINFYVIATVLGWTWFAERTNPAVQFIAHTFFYGCTLSYLLARRGHRSFGGLMAFEHRAEKAALVQKSAVIARLNKRRIRTKYRQPDRPLRVSRQPPVRLRRASSPETQGCLVDYSLDGFGTSREQRDCWRSATKRRNHHS